MEHALQGCAINMFYLGCGETLIMDPIIDLVRKVNVDQRKLNLVIMATLSDFMFWSCIDL